VATFSGEQDRTSRLGIYRIAAERELAVDEAAALFINVLSGKTDGLGVKKKDQYSDNYEIRYQYMPAAVKALLSMGERGEAILGEFLRGERGPALARITIGFVIIQVGSEISAEARQKFAPGFRQDLAAAAIRDKDPEVRAYALSALRLVMNREELIRTVRPLFRDPNKDVIDEICDLIVQKDSSDFSMGLSKEDGETIMGTLLANSDPYVRGKAAAVLVKVANRVSPEFINRTLERLLLDEEQQPREEALRVLGDLKPASASSLARVLKTGQADRVLIGGLAAGIVSLGPDGKALLPDLLTLQNRFPHAVPLIEALGAVANEDPTITSILIEQLRSDDEGVRNAALNALSARHFFVSGSETYLAALIEEKTPTHLETYLGNILEKIRPYSGPVPLSGRVENFPQFPWPPPPWSFKEIVPKNLLGAQNVDLSRVADRLATALRAASPDYDYGLFEIPGGFVLLARLERITPDGTRLPGRGGWSEDPIVATSLEDYLIDLFFSPPGYYRVVAFAITNEEPIKPAPEAELPRFGEGAKSLPDRIAQLPFSDRQAYALIYTFKRYDGAKMVLNYQGSPSGLSHLVASGIWGALGRPSEANGVPATDPRIYCAAAAVRVSRKAGITSFAKRSRSGAGRRAGCRAGWRK
jgi:HEAT repeat protein